MPEMNWWIKSVHFKNVRPDRHACPLCLQLAFGAYCTVHQVAKIEATLAAERRATCNIWMGIFFCPAQKTRKQYILSVEIRLKTADNAGF
jgi:hypothetical protein